MKYITKVMIKRYQMMKLGFDFMGYEFANKQELSFHHLIVPKRDCEALGLGDGYLFWNGAILNQATSHDYLHLIETKDREIFEAITKEMIDENLKMCLDISNIRRIHDMLKTFEREHYCDRSKKGKRLIKNNYLQRKKF